MKMSGGARIGSTALWAIVATVLSAASLAASAAYASSVSSGSVQSVGGTGQVSVSCPSSGCSVQGISWTLSIATGSAPQVSGAGVQWQPASQGGSYQVYVTVYDQAGSVVGSGSSLQPGSSSAVTTFVRFGTSFSFSSASSVQVDIVQLS
jgi:hypothetical protein